ncbi:DNA-binding domain-containing protein [Ancylomarina sp.]|uniref:DNA-binding domain-containing protein n=1 Tax=Ancylomarina sp. TaxID=1970196 RepID=UPI0035629860
MTLPFILRKNHLTERDDDYSAQPLAFDTLDMDTLIQKSVKRHSSLNVADSTIAIRAFQEQVYEELLAGNNIITPMCNIRLSISGVFDGDNMEFNPEKHKVNLNFNAGIDFKGLPNEIKLKKMATADVLPELEYFEDSDSHTRNETITPGKAAIIKGARIKINQESAEEGIFFIAEDNNETKVETYLRNMPSELIFSTPETLAAGKYHVEVRSKLEGKTLRIGELEYALTVN